MCFLMGAAAGGMLPVTYALLAETMPSKQRGWALVLVGGLGAARRLPRGERFSAWLVPHFSWRILWFLNLPTGWLLISLNGFIPESAKFLLALGRVREAHAVLRRFGCVVRDERDARGRWRAGDARVARRRMRAARYRGRRRAQHRRARLGPDQLRAPALDAGAPRRQGLQHGVSSELLAASALIAVPTVFVAALALQPLEQQGRAAGATALSALGLVGMLGAGSLAGRLRSPVSSSRC